MLSFFINILKFDKNIILSFLEILLIIVSSAGLLHGVLLAFYLCFFKKKKTLPNLLFGLILIFMAFRIGKSVMMNFGNNLEPIFIFAGLAFLLLIGPLLKWYVLGMTHPNFKLPKNYVIELIPFFIVFASSLFITKEWFESNKKVAFILFSSVLLFIYLHFAFYIFLSWQSVQKVKRSHQINTQTKSQKAIFNWLRMLIIGFVIIWFSYVLNILDDAVPYVIGPIVYSLAVYFLSYKAFQLKATDIDGEVFKENDKAELFSEISKLVIIEKLYLEPDLSLSKLSKLIGQSTQKTSSVINQYAKRNFNDFINHYRIQDAKGMLSSIESEKFTISSIAFDTGFSSLSSFNSAFKKFEGTTPSSYRKNKLN
ncbi:AraC-type DNA-binding domain-containing protein-like protein [Flavobacteriales bacterium ALC-1]|nr:AraC-type DNA-binding domain-containing protein-like protein [Flavobacteriales bacterium ALC-1]